MSFIDVKALNKIDDLKINFNPDGWGPMGGEKLAAFSDVPYSHFDKKDKFGRPADFVQQQNYRRYRRDDYGNNDFSFKHDTAEDNTFQLVDTSKSQSKSKYGKKQNRTQQNNKFIKDKNTAIRGKFGLQNEAGKSKFNKKNGNRGYRRNDRKADRMPSLIVGSDWEMVEEFDLPQLLKLAANQPTSEDLAWCGHLDQCDDNYDKVTTRTGKVLRKFENKLFYYVTTMDDPVIEKLAVGEIGDVFATDAILAQLMAAPRSVYSWDIIIQKVNGKIFLDKRDNSNFDYLTVSETANDPPTITDDMPEYNYPDNLSLEATKINQNFSQQVLRSAENNRKQFEPNPFFDEGEEGLEPASVAYRYRKFNLGNIRLVARCELHCWSDKRGVDQLMTCFALNEWDSKYASGVNWRQKIDQQPGAVLATELKNNSCKLAKWVAQSILADATVMKLGYVSRVAPTNPQEHTILSTQVFKPKELAAQMYMSLTNIWGIVKMVCELLLGKEDGKYVMLKDPNKPIVRLYAVPLGTFEEEDSDEDSDDDEDEEDEEANNSDEVPEEEGN